MKKQQIKNEDPSINFRLSPEMKKWVTNKANSNNITVSNYLRDHLEKFMRGTLFDELVVWNNDYLPYIKSVDFIKLITFVFSKRKNKNCTSTDQQLDSYIKTIKMMDLDEIPAEIISEFDKVLVDLIRVKNEKLKYNTATFSFSEISYSQPYFNYDLLEDFLLNKVAPYQTHMVYV